MFANGDDLLAAVSHWGTTSLAAFRRAIDTAPPPQGGGFESTPRSLAARALEALGHCATDYEASTLTISPPVIARLPVRGLPQAAMCGFRTPDFIAQVREAGRNAEGRVFMRTDDQARPWAPKRILLEAEAASDFDALATAVRCHAPAEPPALSLLDMAPTLETYESTLTWQPASELSWARRDFNPERLYFASPQEGQSFRLSRYLDPVRQTHVHFLRRGASHARCDRSWGRYLILNELRGDVLGYDERRHCLQVPSTVPLPALLARALTLCTGLAPHLIYGPERDPAAQRPPAVDVFVGVPKAVALRTAEKLGQRLVPTEVDPWRGGPANA